MCSPAWWMAHRAWGGQAEAPSAESQLKDALRNLYKLVHPDLFSDNLMAKVNAWGEHGLLI